MLDFGYKEVGLVMWRGGGCGDVTCWSAQISTSRAVSVQDHAAQWAAEERTSSNWSIYDFEDFVGVWVWSFQLYGCGVACGNSFESAGQS